MRAPRGWSSDRGELTLYAAFVVVGVLIMLSIPLSLWHVHNTRKHMQRVADTAANDCAAAALDEARYDAASAVELAIVDGELAGRASLGRQNVAGSATVRATRSYCTVTITQSVNTLIALARPITITVEADAVPAAGT